MICDSEKGEHFIKLSKKNEPGKFNDTLIYKTPNCKYTKEEIFWADVDGDGKADLICEYHKPHGYRIHKSLGDGKFKELGKVNLKFCDEGSEHS